jgi:hypothetical protein
MKMDRIFNGGLSPETTEFAKIALVISLIYNLSDAHEMRYRARQPDGLHGTASVVENCSLPLLRGACNNFASFESLLRFISTSNGRLDTVLTVLKVAGLRFMGHPL